MDISRTNAEFADFTGVTDFTTNIENPRYNLREFQADEQGKCGVEPFLFEVGEAKVGAECFVGRGDF